MLRDLFRPETLQRNDPVVVAVGRSAPFAVIVGMLVMYEFLAYGLVIAMGAGLLALAASWVLMAGGALLVSHLAARAGAALLWPSGRGTPGEEDFSVEKALLARGKVDEALKWLRRRLAREPGNAALCIFAADVFARDGNDPRRAETLFRRAKELRPRAPGQDLYATNRLIDLYLGPLDRPDRAAEELRYLVTEHPGTREARHAEQAIRALSGASPRA